MSARRRRHGAQSAATAALLFAAACASPALADDTGERIGAVCRDPRIANAWRVLRVVDCARCHGRNYAGLAAPSIVDYAATRDRETFDRMVLDGDPARGMPGYRSNVYVSRNLDDIYRYFIARADGTIGADYRPPVSNDEGRCGTNGRGSAGSDAR